MKKSMFVLVGVLKLLGVSSTPVTLASESGGVQAVQASDSASSVDSSQEAQIQAVLAQVNAGKTCYRPCRMKCRF